MGKGRGPEQVLDYLGRYTHRVAISNHRIVNVENGKPARHRSRSGLPAIAMAGSHFGAMTIRRWQAGEAGGVTFQYRDRKDNDTVKVMPLEADEFIRRFLLHVLPDGFMRIRHFGFLANRSKKKDLGRCRELLGLSPELPQPSKKTTQQLMLELTGIDVTKCPFCKKGTIKIIGKIPEFSGGFFNAYFSAPKIKDTS